MGTYAHTIRPLKRGSLPHRFLVLAAAPVVTRIGAGLPLFIEQLRLGALTYLCRDGDCSWSIRDDVYDSSETLLGLLYKYGTRKEVTWIVAHGLAYHLAVSGMLRHFVDGGVTVEGYHLTGRYLTARLKISGKVYHCVDTYNFVDKSWEWVCRACKVDQAPPFDDTDSDSTALDKARLEVHAVCELVMRLCALLHNHAGCSWGWSIGSLAWQAWRRGFMGDTVHIHDHKEAHELERAAYLGARQECRYIGKINGTVNVVDANSMYGYVMQDQLPVKFTGMSHNPPIEWVKQSVLDGNMCVAECVVNATVNEYPWWYWPSNSPPPTQPSALPANMTARTQNRKVWGHGHFRTTLSTPEIRRAIETQELVTVVRAAWYQPGRPFSSFVHYWSAKRDEFRRPGGDIQEHLTKRLVAILHGKFAQWSSEWIDEPACTPANPIGHWLHYDCQTGLASLFRALGNKAQRYRVKGEWKHSFVALSAHVTSAARIHLDNAVEICGPLDCYYVDNDALHVSVTGLERLADAGLVSETKIGCFKVKGVHYGGSYRNVRDYRLGEDLGKGQGVAPSADDRETSSARSTGAATPRATDNSGYGTTQLSALSSTCTESQVFRPGHLGWSSSLSVQSASRFRYAGRVGPDGWVRPLVLPLYQAQQQQQELYRESDTKGKRQSSLFRT